MGEAKASGNLGNTLKVLQRFDEAVVCCQRHLDIAQEQGDKVRPPLPAHSPWDWGLRDTCHSQPPALTLWEEGARTAPLRDEGSFCACRHCGAEGWFPKLESAAPHLSWQFPPHWPPPESASTPSLLPGPRERRVTRPWEEAWLQRQTSVK